VLLDANDQPHLTDFGLARLNAAGARLTRAGSILGTPAYLAPEQAEGRSDQAGAASDNGTRVAHRKKASSSVGAMGTSRSAMRRWT
jgi:serine/threonine protein kinase